MKRFLVIGIMVFLALSFFGCGQHDEATDTNERALADQEYARADELLACRIPDTLSFSSLEQFAESHRAARNGRAVGELADTAKSVNFSEIEKFYVPTGIPEAYQLYDITVTEETVSFWYLLEKDLVSDEAISNALSQSQGLQFSFTRWELDSPMEGIMRQFDASEEDLIDEKYLFVEPNMLIWALDRTIAYLYVPLSLCDTRSEVVEMARYAEVNMLS